MRPVHSVGQRRGQEKAAKEVKEVAIIRPELRYFHTNI